MEAEPKPPTGPPLYKRPLFWSMIGALLFIAAVAGIWSFYERRHFVSTNDAYIEVKKVSISPDIPGRILKLYVDEGSRVCCGDLIAELDPSIELARKEKALRQELKMQKVLMQAKQKMLKLEEDYGRIAKAYDEGIATRRERDDLMRDFTIAEIGMRIARIDVEIAGAQIAWINENLRHLKIYAPTDGVIAKRWLWEGDTAAFGQSIFILNDLSEMWVTANLEETKLTHVRLGDPVEISVDSYPDQHFSGKVFAIKAMAASQVSLLPPDNAAGNFTKVEQRIPIKITLEQSGGSNDNLHLFPGMSAEVKMRIR